MRISDWSSDVCSSDLVLGGLEQTGLVAVRAGEAALQMAEEFALHQLRRNRAAIDRHERSTCTRSFLMNELGDQFLSGARFAGDMHGALPAFPELHGGKRGVTGQVV